MRMNHSLYGSAVALFLLFYTVCRLNVKFLWILYPRSLSDILSMVTVLILPPFKGLQHVYACVTLPTSYFAYSHFAYLGT